MDSELEELEGAQEEAEDDFLGFLATGAGL
jgi:hypothetical protein